MIGHRKEDGQLVEIVSDDEGKYLVVYVPDKYLGVPVQGLYTKSEWVPKEEIEVAGEV